MGYTIEEAQALTQKMTSSRVLNGEVSYEDVLELRDYNVWLASELQKHKKVILSLVCNIKRINNITKQFEDCYE